MDIRTLKSEYYYKDGSLHYIETDKKAAYLEKFGTKEYMRIWRAGKRYMEHRLIWEIHNGPIPPNLQIDHINQNKTDNRIENLRLCTDEQNRRNCNRVGGSGLRGVTFNKARKKWIARISVSKKLICLGAFTTKEEAYKARVKAESEYNLSEWYPDS